MLTELVRWLTPVGGPRISIHRTTARGAPSTRSTKSFASSESCGGGGTANVCGAPAGTALTLTSDWGAGYCASVTITNTGSAPISSWQVVVDLDQSTLTNLWSGAVSQSGSLLTVTPLSWNAPIAVGAAISFGFCGTSAEPTYRPTVVSTTTTP